MEKIFAVIDTETVGEMDEDYLGAFDVGATVINRKGELLDSINILILTNLDIENAFYGKRKIEIYRKLIRNENIVIAYNETEALEILDEFFEINNVTTICAYNSSFDFTRTFLKYRVDEFEFIDIWKAFLETVATKKKYEKFCIENDYLTKNGKPRATAEIAYRFLTNDNDFIESHTALDDAIIETEILKAVWNTHKGFTRNRHQLPPRN